MEVVCYVILNNLQTTINQNVELIICVEGREEKRVSSDEWCMEVPPLQDAGPSTTLLVRTMRSWAVSSFKPRILLAPWHSYNPMQGYEAL